VQTLDNPSLSPDERALLERFAAVAKDQLGPSLHAVWLFCSRARGEPPTHEDSDVDLLVLVDDDSWKGKRQVRSTLLAAARELGLEDLSLWFTLHVRIPEWLGRRREIKSFFMAEVDRDKIVGEGSA
jgi:predicted nucleotidyltransferase